MSRSEESYNGETPESLGMESKPENTGTSLVNSGEKSVPGRFLKGADPRRAKGVKGRGGRPSNEFRESLRALLDSPKVKAAVKKILSDPDHPQFASLYGKLIAQAHGNPATPLEHSGPEGGPFQVSVIHQVIDPGAS
jgi:hypothetical protein